MSLWFGRAPDVCDLCGHRETAREVVRQPGRQTWGDYVFTWSEGEKVCHWCAQRVHGYASYIPTRGTA